MTEREGGIAAMVESLVATMQYIEKATLNEAPRGLPLVEACAKAISDFDTITPRPLTAEDQARAVLDFLANVRDEPTLGRAEASKPKNGNL